MINIAIDGPSGAGKSSIARYAAEQLGFIYADTGALYRAMGLFILQRGGNIYDRAAVAAMLPLVNIELRYVNGEQRVYLCGENVTKVIRTAEVSRAASAVGKIPAVRDALLEIQLDIARNNHVVMDGRDIGTVILPDADLKIFLTASAEERAKRRYDELISQGYKTDYESVLLDIKERDYADANRPISPTRPAYDAYIIDTTGKSFEEAATLVTNLIREKTGCGLLP